MTRKIIFSVSKCVLSFFFSFLAAFLLSSVTSSSAFFMTPVAHAEEQMYLFLGDSRFVGMHAAVGDYSNAIWLCKVGVGESFFFENEDYINSLDRDNTIIIYALGVNDLDSSSCVQALGELVAQGFQHVWFSTVTPVDEGKASSYGYTITNARIEDFNNTVLFNLPAGVGVIDSFYYLWNSGIQTDDGLHYYPDTYIYWFQILTSQAQT